MVEFSAHYSCADVIFYRRVFNTKKKIANVPDTMIQNDGAKCDLKRHCIFLAAVFSVLIGSQVFVLF